MSSTLPPTTLSAPSMFFKSNVRTEPRPPSADLDLSGKTVLVTGANSGIGFAAAKQFLEHGASRLVIGVRSLEKGERAAETLRAFRRDPDAEILVWELDMVSYDSVRRFAARCATDLPPLAGAKNKTARGLDIAILNAGIALATHKLSPHTKHEETIQTNYLSTALLAILLLPVLKGPGADPGRLTIVGSNMGHMAKFATHAADPLLPTFDDEKNWVGGVERYAVSKALVDMLLAKLGEQELVDADGNGVAVNAIEPGFVKSSNLTRDTPFGPQRLMFWAMSKVGGRTTEEGAYMYLWAAAEADAWETHGSFLMDWEIFPFPAIMYTAEGKAATERLWRETLEELDFAGVRNILRSMGVRGIGQGLVSSQPFGGYGSGA